MTKTLTLKSFMINKLWSGDEYTATIEFQSDYGEQKIRLTAEQAARVLDAALEALADAASHQADLIRNQVTAELTRVTEKNRTAALAAPVDAEVI